MRLLLLFLLFSISSVFAERIPVFIQDIDLNQKQIVLNDDSEWTLKKFDSFWNQCGWSLVEGSNISSWEVGDEIDIRYPYTGNFSDFALIFYNVAKKNDAWVALKSPPKVENPDCLVVISFDEDTRHLLLSDGTIWIKSDVDLNGALFGSPPSKNKNWLPGNPLTLVRSPKTWLTDELFCLWNHEVEEMPIIHELSSDLTELN